jgi:hypothetical protein
MYWAILKSMTRTPSKVVFKRAKRAQAERKRINVTFKLNEKLADGFRDYCKDGEITMSEVLEAFLEDLLKD